MDEEETFRRLRQSSFEELQSKHAVLGFGLGRDELDNLCKSNGWTYSEYIQEDSKRVSKMLDDMIETIRNIGLKTYGNN